MRNENFFIKKEHSMYKIIRGLKKSKITHCITNNGNSMEYSVKTLREKYITVQKRSKHLHFD